MAEKLDDITIAYTDPASGAELVRELDKVFLTRGAWSTIVFRFQDRARAEAEWSPVKYRVARYKKSGGVFRAQSKFNISSAEQARALMEILAGWLAADDA
jgi:hypothetical protein